MYVQRFFIPPQTIAQKDIHISDPEILFQMNRVLRFHAGDRCILLDNTGTEYECGVTECGPKMARLKLIRRGVNEAEPEIALTLFQALPKKMELFEWVLQKGTEIGVSKFAPLVSARTERENFPKRDRLEKILQEAAEQSERGKIPVLAEVIAFDRAIQSKDNRSPVRILLHSRGDSPPFGSFVTQIRAKGSCELFVGPEGGFSEEEVGSAKKAGFQIASLDKRILRTETAGIVAGSLIFYSE